MKSRKKNRSKLLNSVSRRLDAYAMAAVAAGAGVLALAKPADAKIVYTKANFRVHKDSFSVDFNHDGMYDANVNVA